MNAYDITERLTAHTAKNSNFETKRDYISISNCSLSVEDIIKQFKYGFPDSIDVRLKCYKGYQMERDLLNRIRSEFPKNLTGYREILAFDGIVKGHPDFYFDSYPSDCKSVLMDEWIPQNCKLPRKVYWQMQGYMLYSRPRKNRALIIYESRQTGILKAFWISENSNIQSQIDQKMREVTSKIFK